MVTKKAYLFFPKCETEKPIVYRLVKDYDLIINIFRAKVTPEEEGYLSLEMTGPEENINRAFDYLKTLDINISVANKGVYWDSEKCIHCGNCTVHCPTKALDFIDKNNREISYHEELCIECLSCITNCPFGTCSSEF